MKTAILVVTLTCACFSSALAQANQNLRMKKPADNRANFPYRIQPEFRFNDEFNANGFRQPATDNLYVLKQRPGFQSGNKFEQRMPCYKPEGIFSMRVVPPDNTTNYTMLIEKF